MNSIIHAFLILLKKFLIESLESQKVFMTKFRVSNPLAIVCSPSLVLDFSLYCDANISQKGLEQWKDYISHVT